MTLTGKTFRQPIGKWPRHRTLRISVEGFVSWLDVTAGEPLRSGDEVHGLQGEDDEALRRAAHRALDEALAAVLPRLPVPEEWVTWHTVGGNANSPYAWWHRVVRRTPGRMSPVCQTTEISDAEAVFGGAETNNWGRCPACHAGRSWAPDEASRMLLASGTG